MGKVIAIFLILYFCYYIFRRIKYRDYYRYKIYRHFKDVDEQETNDINVKSRIIDIDLDDEDDPQRPKYLH